MASRRIRVWWSLFLSLTLGSGLVLLPASAAPADRAPELSLGELSTASWQLASEGKLDDLWQKVRSLAGSANAPATVTALKRDLEAYESHEVDRRQTTAKAFEKQLAQFHQRTTESNLNLTKALTAAVSAHALAADPKTFRNGPEILALVAVAEAAAQDHEKNGRWLKAMILYRGLEGLFENESRYADPLLRVTRRVALLRLYAPEVLFTLYVAEAAERGDKAPEPWNIAEDHWQTQLEDVEMNMLVESLVRCVDYHVEGTTFESLLLGAVQSLRLLAETQGLAETFPNLGDPARSAPFLKHLKTLEEELAKARPKPMDYTEVGRVLAELLVTNEATVQLPQAVLVHEMGEGAMGRLDEFSQIIWPHQKKFFDRTTRGKFSGVGIQISLVGVDLTVVTPLEDTPAHRAGIRPGDQIKTIDGNSTLGIMLDEAVDKITGVEGTSVVLGIHSPSSNQIRDVTLVRSTIRVESIKGWQRRVGGGWDYYIDPDQALGYIRLTSFGPESAEEMDRAVTQMLEAQGLRGLILDLRSNPGGLLSAAQAISDRFLASGVIVSTTTQPRIQGQSLMAEKKGTYPDFPLVVLINETSASASEIVAGAVQDNHRALIVGQRSYGKGSVQNVPAIGKGKAYLKLTMQYYKLPGGRIIHRRPGNEIWGVQPDVPVRLNYLQAARIRDSRTLLDILRNADEPELDPKAILNRPVDDPDQADEPPPEPVKSAGEILTQGLDPQLETGLLLLKARLLEPLSASKK